MSLPLRPKGKFVSLIAIAVKPILIGLRKANSITALPVLLEPFSFALADKECILGLLDDFISRCRREFHHDIQINRIQKSLGSRLFPASFGSLM